MPGKIVSIPFLSQIDDVEKYMSQYNNLNLDYSKKISLLNNHCNNNGNNTSQFNLGNQFNNNSNNNNSYLNADGSIKFDLNNISQYINNSNHRKKNGYHNNNNNNSYNQTYSKNTNVNNYINNRYQSNKYNLPVHKQNHVVTDHLKQTYAESLYKNSNNTFGSLNSSNESLISHSGSSINSLYNNLNQTYPPNTFSGYNTSKTKDYSPHYNDALTLPYPYHSNFSQQRNTIPYGNESTLNTNSTITTSHTDLGLMDLNSSMAQLSTGPNAISNSKAQQLNSPSLYQSYFGSGAMSSSTAAGNLTSTFTQNSSMSMANSGHALNNTSLAYDSGANYNDINDYLTPTSSRNGNVNDRFKSINWSSTSLNTHETNSINSFGIWNSDMKVWS